MKKDIIAAIAVGFVLGSLTAILAVNLPSLFKSKQSSSGQTETSNVSPTAMPVISPTTNLEILEPADETIHLSKNITVSGKTSIGNTVVIEGSSDLTTPDIKNDGSFTDSITLTEGSNNISIYSFNGQDNEETKTLTVYYTLDKL